MTHAGRSSSFSNRGFLGFEQRSAKAAASRRGGRRGTWSFGIGRFEIRPASESISETGEPGRDHSSIRAQGS